MKKYIYANLKRFDITPENAGINSLAQPTQWGAYLARRICDGLKQISAQIECVICLPESHIISALTELDADSPLKIGCQGVYRRDTAKGVNFGAFTTQRTSKAMRGLGCDFTIIGHCEERADKAEIMSYSGTPDSKAVNSILNEEIHRAQEAGMTVLYCVGEKQEEQERWSEVISEQLKIGLKGVDISRVRIAYEPVWAIGPGRPVPDADYIRKVAKLCKKNLQPSIPVIYGGGLKLENAPMLAGIDELDGGLVGLTRFSGDIGFYPDEFIEIIKKYLQQ